MAAPGASPPEPRQLAIATASALALATLVLVVAVLPAEYGIDPTGLGRALGFAEISDPPLDVNATPGPAAGPRATYEFDARWRLVETEIGNWTGRIERSETQDVVEVDLNVTNLTKLTAELAWIDDMPGPDSLEVSVRGPGDRQSDLARSDSGAANATLVWRAAPYPETNEGALRIETATDATSVGKYRVVIRLYGTGAPEDRGNDWTLRLVAESYALETTSLEGAADRVTLTLAPRLQVEYKFEMEENATMSYRWRASAPLHSDMHGDHFEDPEDFTSAKIATLSEDDGTYVAPFYGRHGWYWRNDGDTTVTIVLETRGAYTILGAV